MSPAGSTHSTESSWADATCRLGGFADLLGVQVHDAVTGRPGPEAKEPFHTICSHCGQNSGKNFPLTVWSCWRRCCRTTYGGKSGAGPSSTCGHNVRFSGAMLAGANVSCWVPTPGSYRRREATDACQHKQPTGPDRLGGEMEHFKAVRLAAKLNWGLQRWLHSTHWDR